MIKAILQHKILRILLVLGFSFQVQAARGAQEFITSCAYGTVAGTLVGVASLAFTEKPGDNLNYIARGASLGLYAGIALGLYVLYGSSDEDPVVTQARLTPRVWVEPVWSQRKPKGWIAHLSVLSF